jgi:Fic-DOC domain mobile mystery protein B
MHIYPEGATPLDPDEAEGLIPTHIKTLIELNEWEQNNILIAVNWAFSHQRKDILTIEFIKMLHKKMFGRTWKWAGTFRKSNKNIGVDWPLIVNELGMLLKEVEYQLNNNTYSVKEIAVRFHHKLVLVHCFANGNGRHARLMIDILLTLNKSKVFSWGKGDL